MDYYSDACDRTIKTKSNLKVNISKVLDITILKKMYTKNHTIEHPDFFDIYEIFNTDITNHNEKFDFNMVEYGFKLVSDEQI